MRLGDLTSKMDVRLRDSSSEAAIDVSGVTEDSRAARAGSLFIARGGRSADGRAYIKDAVGAGACAVLTDEVGAVRVPRGVGCVVSEAVARDGAVIAERCAGEPTKRLHLIGVTGTNGKSTVVEFVQQLMGAAGRRCGLIGTVRVDDGHVSAAATLTTPGAPALSAIIGKMVDNACDSAAMEVSSHALDQDRAAGLHFRTAVFTNLTGDHQDYHGTMDTYAGAKATLFAMLPADGLAIVNADDAAHERMLRDCRARVLRGGRDAHPTKQEGEARVVVLGAATLEGVLARFEGPWGAIEARVAVIGAYNLNNALFAVAAAFDAGVAAERLELGLGRLRMPEGRLEGVLATRGETKVHVFVDYAHTDDALEHVLCAVRGAMPKGAALRVVFGCGGDRDTTKRARMGAVAAKWADALVITSDNPRSEDPQAIVRAVLAGVPRDRRVQTITEVDRRVAIERAVGDARDGDVVVIAGKGHETYQVLGAERIDFDDRVVARGALDRRTPPPGPEGGGEEKIHHRGAEDTEKKEQNLWVEKKEEHLWMK